MEQSETTRFGQMTFDEWAALAKSNPDLLEVKRLEVIAEAIAAAPEAHRAALLQLQEAINTLREELHDNPLQLAATLQDLMMQNANRIDAELCKLKALLPT